VGNSVQNGGGTGIAMHSIGATVTDNVVDKTNGAGIKIVPGGGQSAASRVERNTLRNNKFSGLQIDSAYNMTVAGNTIERNLGGGIFVYQGLSNSTITGNTVRDNNYDKQGGWQGGIYIHHASNSTISNNQIYDTRSGSARTQDNAIVLNAVSAGGIKNLKITNNVCRNHWAHGISLQTNGSGTMSDIDLSGNSCTQNGNYALDVYERLPYAIRNVREGSNTFDGNGIGRIADNTLQRVISGLVTVIESLQASITSPANNSTVSGTVSLSASVTGGNTIAGVQFKIDGANFGSEIRTAPFSLALNTDNLTNGTHSVSATARDSSGQIVNSSTIYFTVNNTDLTPPPSTTSGPFVTSYAPGSLVTGGATGWVGMRIRVGSAPITVTHLGRWKYSNNTQTHTLKIVNAATGSDVAASSVQLSMSGKASGQFAYQALSTPVTLNANTEYMIISSEHVVMNNGDFFYDFNGRMTTTAAAQVVGAVYNNGGGWTRLGSTNNSIGPVTFQYR